MSIRSHIEAGERISTENALWLEDMADLYGAQTANPDALLCRVDVVPPSLAIAQAAEESGWGTSRFAREGNALFGQRIYRDNRKGLVPEDRKEGEVFRVRAFDRLIDGGLDVDATSESTSEGGPLDSVSDTSGVAWRNTFPIIVIPNLARSNHR